MCSHPFGSPKKGYCLLYGYFFLFFFILAVNSLIRLWFALYPFPLFLFPPLFYVVLKLSRLSFFSCHSFSHFSVNLLCCCTLCILVASQNMTCWFCFGLSVSVYLVVKLCYSHSLLLSPSFLQLVLQLLPCLQLCPGHTE